MTHFSRGSKRTPVNLAELNTIKSYASVENLQKGLDRLNIGDHFHVKVCLPNNRWTAIFPGSNIEGGYVALYASLGFFTLG